MARVLLGNPYLYTREDSSMNAVATQQGPIGWTIAQWLSAYENDGVTPDTLLPSLLPAPDAAADNAWISRVSAPVLARQLDDLRLLLAAAGGGQQQAQVVELARQHRRADPRDPRVVGGGVRRGQQGRQQRIRGHPVVFIGRQPLRDRPTDGALLRCYGIHAGILSCIQVRIPKQYACHVGRAPRRHCARRAAAPRRPPRARGRRTRSGQGPHRFCARGTRLNRAVIVPPPPPARPFSLSLHTAHRAPRCAWHAFCF